MQTRTRTHTRWRVSNVICACVYVSVSVRAKNDACDTPAKESEIQKISDPLHSSRDAFMCDMARIFLSCLDHM